MCGKWRDRDGGLSTGKRRDEEGAAGKSGKKRNIQ